MELSEFVSETLSEIEKGVQKARDASSGPWIGLGHVGGEKVWESQEVNFEVSVAATTQGGGGISVVGFGMLEGGHSSESANKISFSVPVFFNSIVKKEEN